MITCQFEDSGTGKLRHVVANNIVVKDGTFLLEKRAQNLLEGGKWSLPGGFMSRDESTSQTALRELKEETGWNGTIQELFCIITYPFRSHEDRQNVAFCYVIKPGTETGDYDTESTDRKWFDTQELETLDIAFDHYKILKKYIETQNKNAHYPLIIESELDY